MKFNFKHEFIILDRLEQMYVNMKSSFDGFNVKYTMLERNSQDEVQRLWDNLHDLQELSNITSKNLEEIYDKDIQSLQHFQNVATEELKRIKVDVGNFQSGATAVAQRQPNNNNMFQEKIFQLQDSIQMIRNSNKVNQNLFQNFNSDLNRAFVDIDDLKKFRQKMLVEIQLMKRFKDRIEVDAVEESLIKIVDMERKIETLEATVGRQTKKMRNMKSQPQSSNEVDEEKVDLLLKEIQNMKTQMFFLQQSILQMRTQEHLSLEVGNGEVGPAYNNEDSELAEDVARLKTDVEMIMGRLRMMENQISQGEFVRTNVFDIRNNALVERIDDVEEKVNNARIVTDACEVASEALRRDLTSLSDLLRDVRLYI